MAVMEEMEFWQWRKAEQNLTGLAQKVGLLMKKKRTGVGMVLRTLD